MDRKDKLDAGGGNQFSNWRELSPEHTEFIEFIKSLPIHLICTMRTKQEYVLVENERGKKQPQKVGLAPIQRDGVDYEFSLVFDLDKDSKRARIMKDRTRLNGKPLFAADEAIDLTDPEVAERIWLWYTSGARIELEKLTDQDLRDIAKGMLDHQISREEFAGWLKQTMGFDTSRDIPRNRLREVMHYLANPKQQQSNSEKVARQSMRALSFTPVQIGEMVGKYRGNWDAINKDLENRAMDQSTAFDPAEENQDPLSASSTESTDAPGEEYSYNPPDLICTVQNAVRRENASREFMEITLPVSIEGTNVATCWHKTRFPALSSSIGHNCHFVVKPSKKGDYLTIEEVIRVGLTEYEYVDGKHRIKKAAEA
jgi:hypothetical protein